ncbi:MAG: mechanosensitive ion channel [Spirulina sp. SIO3F2]|nr:mechanosensitive ion channel [Spirulina sp. SIO3F2]
MEKLLELVRDVDYSTLPFGKIIFFVCVFIAVILLRQIFFAVVIKQIERLASQTETELDDELLKILKPVTSLSLYIGVIWLIPLMFAEDLSPQLNESITGLIKILTLVGVIFIIYRLSSVLGLFATNAIVTVLKLITRKKEEPVDPELLKILRPSIRLLVFLIGLWILQLLLGNQLSTQVNDTFSNGLSLLTIVIITNVLYRSAPVLGEICANLLVATIEDDGLNELLRPFLPKIFQGAAIVILIIKGTELFLGGSTGALVGLLGGAGITLGLLFKDLIYDWFCTVIIYTDKLYNVGDWIVVSGLDAMVQVVDIGFRSTSLLSSTRASIQKVPNSKMISGIFQNWSQDAGDEEVWGIPITLKIDGISAQQAASVCEGLKSIHQSLEGVKDKHLIRFKGLEQNARVFEFRLYTQLSSFFRIEREAHIAILAMLEEKGINTLYVELRTDPERYQQQLKGLEN